MYNQMIQPTTHKPRKSVKIDDCDLAAFSEWVDRQPSKGDAALAMGVARGTIDRMLVFKTCHPRTAEKLKMFCRQDVGAAMEQLK
jgi:hypothetical protein